MFSLGVAARPAAVTPGHSSELFCLYTHTHTHTIFQDSIKHNRHTPVKTHSFPHRQSWRWLSRAPSAQLVSICGCCSLAAAALRGHEEARWNPFMSSAAVRESDWRDGEAPLVTNGVLSSMDVLTAWAVTNPAVARLLWVLVLVLATLLLWFFFFCCYSWNHSASPSMERYLAGRCPPPSNSPLCGCVEACDMLTIL